MIQYSALPDSPVIEVRVAGHVTSHELQAASDQLRHDLAENGKTRILEIVEHFTGMEATALWSDFKLGMELASKVSRVAVVADQGWVRSFAHLGRFFIRAEMRIFTPGELDQARAWMAED